MTYLADLIIAAVLVLAVWLGARRGLLKTMAGLAVVLLALWGASLAADHLTDPVAAWLEPILTQGIEEKLSVSDTADAGQMLEAFRFRGDSLERMLELVQQRVQETGQSILKAVAASVSHAIAGTAVYLAAFLLLLILLRLLVRPLDRLAHKLPVVRTVNALGGGALGLMCSVLLLFVAVWVMQRFGLLLTPELVDSSILLKFFASHTPLGLLAAL